MLRKSRSANSVGLGTRPLPISSTIEPLTSLESSGLPEGSAHLNVLSRSPSHSTTKSDPKSLKSLSPSARSSTIRSSSPHPLKSFSSTRDTVDKPEKSEKHHKKKESGISWEQKKFAQHFAQVPDDEVVLDYFSCALVGDILLQGYLYITQNYFAFYSNVFGYVTKLLIPTISVLDISREKTAYMFPNAVGVKTRDDRHVFGSFLSREAAYYLMCSVWDRATNPNTSDSFSTIQQHSRLATLHAEGSEGSLDEDSSCYDGNESSFHGKDEIPDLLDSGDSNGKQANASNDGGAGTNQSSDDSTTRLKQKKHKKELLLKSPAIVKSPVILKATVAAGGLQVDAKTMPTLSTALAGGLIGDGGVPRVGTVYSDSNANSSNSSSDASGSRSRFSKIKEKLQHILPSDFGIIHIGILLTVLLALFSCFLAYKIYALQARLSAPRIRLGDDTDFYLDVLRWQKRLHSKSKEEAQLVLNSNLEQIVRVRKSLETLSILLQDTPSPLDASGVLADLRDGAVGGGDGGIAGNDPSSDDSIAGSIMAAATAAARSSILGDSGSINQQYFHEDAT
uniref:Protein in glucosyltransferase n=1 Tax=Anopheles darlingi TaxID=43151 RepID=A0A2M4CG42_ANODA